MGNDDIPLCVCNSKEFVTHCTDSHFWMCINNFDSVKSKALLLILLVEYLWTHEISIDWNWESKPLKAVNPNEIIALWYENC